MPCICWNEASKEDDVIFFRSKQGSSGFQVLAERFYFKGPGVESSNDSLEMQQFQEEHSKLEVLIEHIKR